MVTVDVLKLDFVSPLTQSSVGKIPIDVPCRSCLACYKATLMRSIWSCTLTSLASL